MNTTATKYNELYVIKCNECHKVFRTDDPFATLCPSCIKFRQPNKPKRKKKASKKPLTITEILRIADIYAKVKHKYLSYGEMLAVINQNVDRCVCCGAIVPEGRHVCPICEKGGN